MAYSTITPNLPAGSILRTQIEAFPTTLETDFAPKCLVKLLQIYLNTASPLSPLIVDGVLGSSTANLLAAQLDVPGFDQYITNKLNETVRSVTGEGTDIAPNAEVLTSPYNTTTYAAENLIDGVDATMTINAANSLPVIRFRFNEPKTVFAVRLSRASANNNSTSYNVQGWELAGSNDSGRTWTFIGESADIIDVGTDSLLQFEDVKFAEYKITVKDTGNHAMMYGLTSVEIFEPTVGEGGGCIFPSNVSEPMYALADINYQNLLNIIFSGESSNSADPRTYELMYGGTLTNPHRFLDEGPIVEKSLGDLKAYQIRYSNAVRAHKAKYGTPTYISHAAGRLQLMRETLIDLQRNYPRYQDFVIFTPDIQDEIAIALMWDRIAESRLMIEHAQYRGTSPSDAEITSLRQKLAKIWASIPYNETDSYYGQPTQHTGSWYDAQLRSVFDGFIAEYNTYIA